jgi:hypothetical protein
MRNTTILSAIAATGTSFVLLTHAAGADPQKIPSPWLCTKPAVIRLVGTGASGPDTSGTFLVVVRDLANNPIAYERVVIDFSNCPDVRLSSQAAPGQFVDCGAHTVIGFTDLYGAITFTIVGAGNNLGGGPGAGLGCASIYGEGVLINHPTVCIYDQDGAVRAPGMGATDLFSFNRDLGTGMFFGRSDFNGDGQLDVRDLSKFLVLMGSGNSAAGSSAGYCP